MGLWSFGTASFGVPGIWGGAELEGEDRGLGKRLGVWEDIVVIGIIEDRRIWSDPRCFPGEQGCGEPVWTLLYHCLARDLEIPGKRRRQCGVSRFSLWGWVYLKLL
jgi:hypothetical protein